MWIINESKKIYNEGKSDVKDMDTRFAIAVYKRDANHK